MPIIKTAQKEITLIPSNHIEISQGDAPKSFLTDGHDLYILKKPKKRTFSSIFKGNFPEDLTPYKNWTIEDFHLKKEHLSITKKTKLEPYVIHLSDLLFEAAFGEVLYQLIAKALFKSFTPTESYLHVEQKTGETCIISKFCLDFNEFMEKKLRSIIGKTIMTSSEWDTQRIPCCADLALNENEYYLLGKLYALALLTNDWDLFNNIMLSNSGCVGDSSNASQIMVVDGGNKFHFGFDGLTCDETAFENNEFNPHAIKRHPLKNYKYTLPFDKAVSIKLPRLLIPDLFSLNQPSLFKGFKEGIEEARTAFITNPFCIRQAIKKMDQLITIDSQEWMIKRFKDPNSTVLNRSYYNAPNNTGYSLEAILKGRCRSLQNLCLRLESGEAIEEMETATLKQYHQAQRTKTMKPRSQTTSSSSDTARQTIFSKL